VSKALASAKRAALPYPRYRHGVPPAALSFNGGLRQRQPRRDNSEHHGHAGADADPLGLALRREHAVRPRQVADHAESLLTANDSSRRLKV